MCTEKKRPPLPDIRLTPYTVFSHGENQLSQLKLVGMIPGSSRAASNAGQAVGPDGKLINSGGPATTAKADEVSTVAAVIKAGTFDLFSIHCMPFDIF